VTALVQDLISAISVGGLYALYALGIALIFGVAGVFNFAQGQLIAVAAYVLLLLSGIPWPFALLGAIASAVLLAVLMERGAFRFVRKADEGILLVMAFGISTVVQSVVLLIAGSQAKSLSFGASLVKPLQIGPFSIVRIDLVTLLVVAVLLISLSLLLKRSKIGIQLRASAEDFTMARLVGVKADTVLLAAFAVSGVLAGAAAVLLSIRSGSITPDVGLEPVLIAFVATVVGGLGSLIGAAVGAFLLGLVTVALQVFLPDPVQPYRDAILFAIVILVLLFRPQGLIPNSAQGTRV
jgi:branched-chain amino acid transport system permease protein